MTKRWEDNVPSALRAKGVRLVDAPSSEVAWPPEHMPQLIAWLRDKGYGVLGGDFYDRKGKDFLPTYTTWYSDIKRGEAWAAYSRRSCGDALERIEKMKKDKYWVVIVASLKPTAEQLVTGRNR